MYIRCGSYHELLKDNDVAKVYFLIQYKNQKKPFKRSFLFHHSPSTVITVTSISFTISAICIKKIIYMINNIFRFVKFVI